MSEIDINKRIDWNEIDSNISKDYDYINNMLELVPPQHYFPQETDMNKLDNRWMRRKKTKKEIEKDKKIKKKMKYDKLDPDSYKSVPQLLQEKGGYESDEENSSEENGENGENEEKPERKIIPGFSSTGLKDRDELKKRLIEKIDSLKKKGKLVIKLTKIDRLRDRELIIIKKKDKKPKIESAQNIKITKNGYEHQNGKESNGENDVDEDIEFGTFDFSSEVPIPTYLSHKKKGKEKKILLEKTMEKQRLLEELKDTEEGKNMKKEVAWDTMMKRAVGEKVKR